MSERYEYRVCNVQAGRVTFVNGNWQGRIGPAGVDPNQALESCPSTWDYLQEAGREGWELVAAVNLPTEGTNLQNLFLKRTR